MKGTPTAATSGRPGARPWLRAVCLFLCATAAALPLRGEPVEIVPPALREAMQPQVAVTTPRSVHVSFGQGSSVWYAASADRGRTFTAPVKVGDLPKLALGLRRGPRMVATPEVLTISAIDHQAGALLAWSSVDGGQHWSPAVQINDVAGSAREGLHAMAGDGRGFVITVWLDLRHTGMELWSATSADSGRTWSANRQVYASPAGHICECCHPSVAVSPQGEIAVMWRNWLNGSRDMYLARSNDGGCTFGAAQKLGDGTWKLDGCPMDGGAVAYDSSGTPVTVWRREKSIFTSAAGRSESKLSSAGVQPVIYAGSTGPELLWQEGSRLLRDRPGSLPQLLAEDAAFASVAAWPDGTAIAVWESATGGRHTLRAQLLEEGAPGF